MPKLKPQNVAEAPPPAATQISSRSPAEELEVEFALTLQRRREVEQEVPLAAAGEQSAVAALEAAKLQADLRPDDPEVKSQVEELEQILDEAIAKRESLSGTIERLRKHEEALAFRRAAVAEVDHREAQAKFRAELAAERRRLARTARWWVALLMAEWEISGRHVGDVCLFIAEHLSGEYRHRALEAFAYQAGVNQVYADVSGIRAAYERGEKLPEVAP